MPRKKPPSTFNHNFPLVKDKDFKLLNPHRRRFVYNYYLKPITKMTDGQCYKEAYCQPNMKPSTAATCASMLLRKYRVAIVINKLDQLELDRLGITAEKILLEEAAIAHSDLANLFDEKGKLTVNPRQLPPQIRRALSSVEVIEDMKTGEKKYKYRLWRKGEALKRLESIRGMGASKKIEVSGPRGGPIEHRVSPAIRLDRLDDDEIKTLTRILDKMEMKEETK